MKNPWRVPLLTRRMWKKAGMNPGFARLALHLVVNVRFAQARAPVPGLPHPLAIWLANGRTKTAITPGARQSRPLQVALCLEADARHPGARPGLALVLDGIALPRRAQRLLSGLLPQPGSDA